MNTLTTDIKLTFKTLMTTMFNQKNLTTNNLVFLIGLMASAGLIVYGLLNILMPAVLSVLIIFAVTTFFGYRTISSNEDMPAAERKTMTTKSTY